MIEIKRIVLDTNFEAEIPIEYHVSGTRQPRSDRTNQDSGWPGGVGSSPGAQRAGDVQHAPRAARQRVRQRLHVLSGIWRRDARESVIGLWDFIVLPLCSAPFHRSTRLCQDNPSFREKIDLNISYIKLKSEKLIENKFMIYKFQ